MKPKTILNPEYYLICLLLPPILWPLMIVIALYTPKAIKPWKQHDTLYYVSTWGELILLGKCQFEHHHHLFSLISCGFGKTVLVVSIKSNHL